MKLLASKYPIQSNHADAQMIGISRLVKSDMI